MDAQMLESLLYASARAYSRQPPRMRGYSSEFLECEETDLQCRIWYGEREIWVAFRGTDSLRDVYTDLLIRKVPARGLCPDARQRVHRGFLRAYECGSFRQTLFEKLRDRGAERVCFTGHSLGGALAVLAALDFRLRDSRPEVWVVTFGAPCVGNRAFCRFFDSKIFEVVHVQNGNDAVTKLPFRLLGYHRTGAVYHIGHRRCPFVFSLKDHRQKAYFQHLLPILLN